MMRVLVAFMVIAHCLKATVSFEEYTPGFLATTDHIVLLQAALHVDRSKPDDGQRALALSRELPARTQNQSEARLGHVRLLFRGYNAFYGSPFDVSEADGGFMKYAGKPIFQTKYVENQTFGERQYLVPDGLRLSSMQNLGSCKATTTISTISRKHQLDSMSAFVSGEDGQRAPGWFTASSTFHTFEGMKGRGLRNVVAFSECLAWNASIDVLGKELELSPALLQRARDLPDTYDRSDYFAFFDEFGTHVPSSASLGALSGVSAFMSEADYAQLPLREGRLENATWEKMRWFNVNRGIGSQLQEGRLQRGEEAPFLWHRNAATDTSDSGVQQWVQAAREEPVPVHLTLTSICRLLGRADVGVPPTRVEHCERAAQPEEYCMLHVMPREGMNPQICMGDNYAGAEAECLWDSDCDRGSSCAGNTCKQNINFARVFADLPPRQADGDVPSIQVTNFSWQLNVILLVPWALISIPLAWIWLEVSKMEGEKDKIWTAEDENLRHVEISSLGISCVALLRRPSDRRWAIRCAFVSFFMQVAFLYFICVLVAVSLQETSIQAVFLKTPMLVFCALVINTLSCCAKLISGAKAWHTEAPEGYEKIHKVLVGLDSFIIPALCIVVGTLFLCTSTGINSLIFRATSMEFMVQFNSRFAGLLSWSLSAHGGRAFKPTEVQIKDDVNSMSYALRSLVFSFATALVIVLIGVIAVNSHHIAQVKAQ